MSNVAEATSELTRSGQARAGHGGLRQGRLASPARSATAVRCASMPRAACIRTSSPRTGSTASTSSKASSARRKSRSCAATPPTCWSGRRSAPAPTSTRGAGRRSAPMRPREPYTLIKPLSDPQGGTEIYGGRHPSKMAEPTPDADAPDDVVLRMRGMCQYMPAGLRVYGHPQLLAIAASINGDDFVPFNDVIFVKQPGVGGSVAWHQDGVTHWDSPNGTKASTASTTRCSSTRPRPGNALWVVPGTHKQGRVDIKRMVAENGGSEQLPEAIPLICAPGDVTIVNRQTLHGSFANTSPDIRISITFGFHRRKSVLGAKTALSMKVEGVFYDEAARRRPRRRHRRRDRRAPPALPGREVVRLPAVRRPRGRLPLQRRDLREGHPRLQPLRSRHLIKFGRPRVDSSRKSLKLPIPTADPFSRARSRVDCTNGLPALA